MKLFKSYKTDYARKFPRIQRIYSGYKGLKSGVALLCNHKFIPLVLPINERR